MAAVLIVEDERRIADLLDAYLKKEGFDTAIAEDGNEAIEFLGKHSPDLILLDLMLPGISGEEVCQYVRENNDTPIIMLTAKADEEARITGFSLGTDDYVTKPFSPREVVERVKAVLRRSHRWGSEAYESPDGSLVIDFERHTVRVHNEAVNLTPTEFRLLSVFVQNPGRAFSRQQLADRIFGLEYEGYEDSIYVHVKNLRQKLDRDPGSKRIATVYGIGYRWEEPTHA